MGRWRNLHRLLVRVNTGNLIVHPEQVAIAFSNYLLTQAIDCIAEIEINCIMIRTNSTAGINLLFG